MPFKSSKECSRVVDADSLYLLKAGFPRSRVYNEVLLCGTSKFLIFKMTDVDTKICNLSRICHPACMSQPVFSFSAGLFAS